jgi:hypothetical protein
MSPRRFAALLGLATLAMSGSMTHAQQGPLDSLFGAIFGQPPRPPGDVGRQPPGAPPTGGFPPTGTRTTAPPAQAGIPPRPGVATEPLPPPPGAGAVPPPLRGQQPVSPLPPGIRPPRGTPQPANTAPQPGDEVIAPPPSQKIVNKTAAFSGLDKITGRIIAFDVAMDETVQFGALRVTPRACYTRPPTENQNTDAFIEVEEITLQGEVRRIFNGWMFAASPGLNAVEHPIYDVWLTDCKDPTTTVAASPPPEAAPAPPPPGQRRR